MNFMSEWCVYPVCVKAHKAPLISKDSTFQKSGQSFLRPWRLRNKMASRSRCPEGFGRILGFLLLGPQKTGHWNTSSRTLPERLSILKRFHTNKQEWFRNIYICQNYTYFVTYDIYIGICHTEKKTVSFFYKHTLSKNNNHQYQTTNHIIFFKQNIYITHRTLIASQKKTTHHPKTFHKKTAHTGHLTSHRWAHFQLCRTFRILRKTRGKP